MPWIINYPTVLERLLADGLVCRYPRGGAFGFDGEGTWMRGWLGPADATIKPAALAWARQVDEPFDVNLAQLARRAWLECLPGNVWIMPGSHWSYELNHGSRDWMPALLERIELDPGLLVGRNDASAVEFAPAEAKLFEHFVQRLLTQLWQSDFTIAFPGRQTVSLLHSHTQLWWMTQDRKVLSELDALLGPGGPPGEG